MTDVNINIKDNQDRFFVGDLVSGVANFGLPPDLPLTNVTVSFHCLGEVKWIERPGTLFYLNGYKYYDQIGYHDEAAKWTEAGEWTLVLMF